MRAAWVMGALLLAGCGSQHSEPKARRDILLDTLDQAAMDRQIVATVNDRPVYNDCVAAQASAHGLERRAALQECIDFELLAQAADTPSYLRDASVQEEGKQELVRAYLAASYPLHGPQDLDEELVRNLWERINVPRYNHPPLRNIVFCRIPLTEDMGPTSREYMAAEAFLSMLYAELKDRRNLVKNDLFAACYDRYEQEGVHDLKLSTTRLAPSTQHDAAWRTQLFADGTEAGQVLPPIVDERGFTFILITEAKDTLVTTFEEAEAELRDALYSVPVYQGQRNRLFEAWYKPIAARYKIERFPERLPASEPMVSLGETKASP